MQIETENRLISRWGDRFNRMCERLASHFGRSEPRERAQQYMLGLLSNAERKNSWQIAETMHEYGPQRMQRLLNAADWDVEAARAECGSCVSEQWGAVY